MPRALTPGMGGKARRYKALAEAAMAQLGDDDLVAVDGESANSIATIVWHVAGNLASRFTDFMASDGEKPWRNRDEEFMARNVSRAQLLANWEQGWSALLGTLASLGDDDLARTVTIRSVPLRVHQARH